MFKHDFNEIFERSISKNLLYTLSCERLPLLIFNCRNKIILCQIGGIPNFEFYEHYFILIIGVQ